MDNLVAGYGRYLLFLVRRERVMSAIWIVALAVTIVGIGAYYPELLPDDESKQAMAIMMDTPSMIAIMGATYGQGALTQAIAMSAQCLLWYFLAIAIMNIFLVNRHTRTDEEAGRLEMLIALPVGRMTGSLAVLSFAAIVNALIGLLTASGLAALNIEGTTVAGAYLFGGIIAAVGFFFAALTLLFAEVFSTSRGVTGVAMGALGLFYVLRASGDVSDNALSIISPLGLALKTHCFYDNRVWPLLIVLAEAVVLAVVALAVNAVRDHGAGVVPARQGRESASRFLRGPFGFAWRVTRSTQIGWAVAMLVIGMMYGSVASSIEQYVADNEVIMQILQAAGGGTMTEQYVSMLFMIFGMIAAVPVILAVYRVHGEETNGRLEQVLARRVDRVRLLMGFILIAAVSPVVMLALGATGLSAGSNGVISMASVMGPAMVYLPAAWIMGGLAVFLVGVAPRLTALIWVYIGWCFLAVYFGIVLKLPEWTADITPFAHIPHLPTDDLHWPTLIVLAAIAVALAVVGVFRYATRDIG